MESTKTIWKTLCACNYFHHFIKLAEAIHIGLSKHLKNVPGTEKNVSIELQICAAHEIRVHLHFGSIASEWFRDDQKWHLDLSDTCSDQHQSSTTIC